MIRILFLFVLLVTFVSSNVLVVIPIRPSIPYDIQMGSNKISLHESESQKKLLDYLVPFGCHTERANVYQKSKNLIVEIPCSVSSAVL